VFGKIEHLGIAVSDLEKSEQLFSLIMGTQPYKREAVESEGVITSFFMAGENKVELLQATNEQSAIFKFIQNKGEGLHHVAFAVENIESEMKRLKNSGIRLLNEIPKKGADNKLICFLHPKDTGGVLIELCQDV
jgi:methylmalonyl-CoA/ethylmalonyl-CoA epimerase